MKYNKTTIAILSSLFVLFPAQANSNTYNSIVHKHSYEIKDATLIPSDEIGIEAYAENKDTNKSVNGDVTKSSISLNTENNHFIEITTNVADSSDGERTLVGEWVSSQPITFIKNDKNNASFYTPNYDGIYYVNLKLNDSTYIKTYQTLKLISEYWTTTVPLYGEWKVDTVVQDWLPELSTEFENELVEQTRIIDRSRTKQEQEIRTSTGDTRNIGSETIETETSISESREEFYGTMEYWEETDPKVIVDWAVTEIFQDWTPDASTVYETETVSQYREIKKERTIQDQEFRPKTGDIRTVGSSYKDTSLLTEYRDVQGELEYWENVGTPTCTEWVLDRYDPWLPDASGYERHEEVDQTRIKYESRECTGQQYRPATGEYRNAESEIEYRSEEEQRTVYGTKIDLNNWFTNDTNGAWSVSNDGSYALQSINGNATIFESAASTYGNTVITGKARVLSSGGDDDWFGMVLGKYDDDNFLLWAWKKNAQSVTGGTALEGHTLANVTGGVSAINVLHHVSRAGYTVIDTNLTTTNGWVHDTYYEFEIKYTPTNISVKVDGNEVVSANGSFSTGKIGFYNFSQGMVEYYKVTDEQIQ